MVQATALENSNTLNFKRNSNLTQAKVAKASAADVRDFATSARPTESEQSHRQGQGKQDSSETDQAVLFTGIYG